MSFTIQLTGFTLGLSILNVDLYGCTGTTSACTGGTINDLTNYLDKNHCVAVPTETVYGLAGNAYSNIAVNKIFNLKKRNKYVFIPNAFSLTEAKARAALADLELKVVVKKIGVKKVKAVTNISPKVGTKVKRGSAVTITVG